MKRKACRKGVKRELRATRGAKAFRDKLRREWVIGRCWACMRCPRLLAKLPAPPMVER